MRHHMCLFNVYFYNPFTDLKAGITTMIHMTLYDNDSFTRIRYIDRRFADDIFKCMENCCISIKILLKFVPDDSINKKPAMVQITNRRQDIIWTNDGL